MRAVLFDLDGTLLDTLPDIARSLNETLLFYGYPACPLAQVRMYVGDGAKKLVERALPAGAADVEEVYAAFRERYGKSDHGLTAPYLGMHEALTELRARGMKLAVITNKPQEAAKACVEKFYGGLFDFVGGDSGMFPCKPDPSLSRYCALTLRVPMGECLFVGDGEADVRTAKSAGMRCVSVLWGYRTREQLAAAGADSFISSPAELRNFCGKF